MGTISVDKADYERLKSLEAAVVKMVTLRGDDICWRDLYTELAKLVGIEFTPELIADKDRMLANCRAFIGSLYSGPYTPVYVEPNTVASEGKSCNMGVKETEHGHGNSG